MRPPFGFRISDVATLLCDVPGPFGLQPNRQILNTMSSNVALAARHCRGTIPYIQTWLNKFAMRHIGFKHTKIRIKFKKNMNKFLKLILRPIFLLHMFLPFSLLNFEIYFGFRYSHFEFSFSERSLSQPLSDK